GHRDEGEPRDGARRDARPRLAAFLLRQDGRGRADESGRPVPEAREGPGGDPACPRVRRGTPEDRQDPMGRPRAVHAETRFQGDRLRTLPGDRGPRDAGARAPPGDPSGPLRRASLPREGTEDAPGARPPAEGTEAEDLRGAAGRGDVRRGGSGEANRVLAGRDSRGAPADGPPAAGRQERPDEVRGFLRRQLVLYLGRPYEARAP